MYFSFLFSFFVFFFFRKNFTLRPIDTFVIPLFFFIKVYKEYYVSFCKGLCYEPLILKIGAITFCQKIVKYNSYYELTLKYICFHSCFLGIMKKMDLPQFQNQRLLWSNNDRLDRLDVTYERTNVCTYIRSLILYWVYKDLWFQRVPVDNERTIIFYRYESDILFSPIAEPAFLHFLSYSFSFVLFSFLFSSVITLRVSGREAHRENTRGRKKRTRQIFTVDSFPVLLRNIIFNCTRPSRITGAFLFI